ncbi:MAG: cytochrome ubiquinol oxidase subunit I, partial [Muribaculaceae bacterium]|nr:cytochrome ubiquinol oxidase subunit I [Muribaculaceae bacterium]
ALTAMYHWLFVPLTIGLSLIVAVMETIYVRTGDARWKGITKFWMTLFGINFACGVATGIILEFEFGTNWANYSWFVGDIFGAPLAIEGIVAFFMESTFIAVMFFGWKKFSRGFHLAATWLTAIGVCLSALWILIANAWMQYPVGMEFDPAQMRNVMSDFFAVVASPVAINKFFHAVTSGWTLAGVFVIGVASWMLWRKTNIEAAKKSIKVGAWVGFAGIVLTLWTGHGSAVQVARVQPMKLAAMEGLYRGRCGQDLVGIGILDPEKRPLDGKDPMLMSIDIPYGLSLLVDGNTTSFVSGIEDLIEGIELTPSGDTIRTVSYADRIMIGKQAHAALSDYSTAMERKDSVAMAEAAARLKVAYPYFGYGYMSSVDQAVPPVGLTFYSFHIMVALGGYLFLFFVAMLIMSYCKTAFLEKPWIHIVAIFSIPLVWICSQAGWIVAEVGRQPWTIQDILPVNAAVSNIESSAVRLTFWIFVVLFTALLAAEVSIMLRQIGRTRSYDIERSK